MKKVYILILAAITFCACQPKTNVDENIPQQDSTQTETVMINPADYQTSNAEGMQEIYQFVKDCEYYMIATVEGDQPHVRPFGTIHIFEGKLYIQTGHKKRTAQQLAQNGKAELCAFNTKTHQWIRVCGTLVEDPRVEAKKSMLDEYSNLRSMYDENDDNTAVYYFTEATAWISGFDIEEKEIKF